MDIVNIHTAKTTLSKLIERVLHGQEVIIGRNGKPVAKIVPYEDSSAATEAQSQKPREFGQWKGKVWYAPDYDEADAIIEKMFNESEIFPKD